MRLKELEEKEFIECIQNQKYPMVVRWTLTEKGKDTVPMLIHFIAFSSTIRNPGNYMSSSITKQ